MTYPVLYSFRRCPYAMRARLALSASRTPVHLREIVLRDKAPEFLESSPKATVPVLILADGTIIDESIDIMHFALKSSDPENIYPAAPALAAEMATLIKTSDTDFKSALDHYKYANRYEGMDALAERERASSFLMSLNERLAGETYLFGEKLTYADLAIAPFVRQFANVDRAWFDAQNWPHLIRWFEVFLASPRFEAIMNKYPKWQSGDEPVLFNPLAEISN